MPGSGWDGAYGDPLHIAIHVEAAAYRNRPVYFDILPPWGTPSGAQSDEVSPRGKALFVLLISVSIVAALAAVWLTWRNLRLGRGDRTGAFRLALYAFSTSMLGWVVSAHHVPQVIGEFALLNKRLAGALLSAGVLWLLYIALEPYVRRRWPHRIVAWTRLLAGDVRNPLVGRDLLIGMLSGVARFLLTVVHILIWKWLGWPAVQLLGTNVGAARDTWLDALLGIGGLANQIIGNQVWMLVSVLRPVVRARPLVHPAEKRLAGRRDNVGARDRGP